MTELQTVETLNCLIERTETPPFYRLTSMRKTSSHSDGNEFKKEINRNHKRSTKQFSFKNLTQYLMVYVFVVLFIGPATGANDSRMPDLAVEKGTIHTKRHSGEDPIKTGYVCSDHQT